MLVHVTTDNHIQGGAELSATVRQTLETALERFRPQLTRVEAHLSDQNSRSKRGLDKECTLEARLAGLAPVATSATGQTVTHAVAAACDKLVKLLERRLGRLSDRRPSGSSGPAAAE